MSVGQRFSPSFPVSRLRMTSGASSGVTLAYILPSLSTETSGPAEHRPMQPTPFTSTSFPMPDSATSFLMRVANLVRAGREATGGDADAHVMRILLLRLAFGLGDLVKFVNGHWRMPFWMRASISVGPDLAEHRVIQHHRRRQAAGAQAARGEQRKLVVRRGLARFDAVRALEGREQGRRALDIARRAGAHHAGVFALRLEGKEVIESGRAIYAAERHAQREGDKPQRGLIEISEALLNGVQGFDERVGFAAMAAGRGLDDFPALIIRGQLGLSRIREHKGNRLHFEFQIFASDFSNMQTAPRANAVRITQFGAKAPRYHWFGFRH